MGRLQHQRGGSLGSLVSQTRQQTGVGVRGQHDAVMPKSLLHHLQLAPNRQHQTGRTMPQIMQPDRRHTSPGRQPAKRMRQIPRAERNTPATSRTQTRSAHRRTPDDARRRDAAAPSPLPRQRHCTNAALGLGRADHGPPVVALHLMRHHQQSVVQVQIAPAEPGGLATTQPHQRDQQI